MLFVVAGRCFKFEDVLWKKHLLHILHLWHLQYAFLCFPDFDKALAFQTWEGSRWDNSDRQDREVFEDGATNYHCRSGKIPSENGNRFLEYSFFL